MQKQLDCIILNLSGISKQGFVHLKAMSDIPAFDAARICQMARALEWSHLKDLLIHINEGAGIWKNICTSTGHVRTCKAK